jgi:aspartate aminotransferase
MSISDKVQKSLEEGSWIRKMFEEGNILKEKYGVENVFDLSLGNPVMEPPPEFNRELKKLVDNPIPGMHRYMENAGYVETRVAVAKQVSLEAGMTFTEDDIIMTCGAAGALNVVLKTILNPGDEVVVFSPYFAEFINYIENHDGIARILPTDGNFLPRLDALEENISLKTRAVLINSPNNPTGVVYGEDFFKQLGQLLDNETRKYGSEIFLINDEAYSSLLYDGLKYAPVWPHYQQSIVVTSHSKDLALPGERIGYIAVNPNLNNRKKFIDGFIHCNRILGYVNASALMQHVIRYLQDVTVSIPEYQRKRDFLYDRLTGMGYSIVKPQGAFYMFPKLPDGDDIGFIRELHRRRVLAVPGRGFGEPGYFRLVYCTDDRTIEGALPVFQKVAEKLGL